jgi:hypothetical protein
MTSPDIDVSAAPFKELFRLVTTVANGRDRVTERKVDGSICENGDRRGRRNALPRQHRVESVLS